MSAYLSRRLLLLIPTLFLLSVLVFLSVRFLPGDVIDVIVGRSEFTGGRVDREAVERRLGRDVPVWVQYGRRMGGILLHGSLGESLMGDWPIEERLFDRLPITLELSVMAILIGLVIALPVGIYSAIRQDTVADFAGRILAILGLATPNFWLGIMVMIYPAIWWNWSPPMELVPFAEDPWGHLGMLVIPSLILGTALSAGTMRLTRTMMLEVLRQDYIRTAWAKGLQERTVVLRHAIKMPLIPVVTRSAGLIGHAAAAHSLRLAVASRGRGRCYHGEPLQSTGLGSSLGGCPLGPGLPGGLRGQPVFRLHRFVEQPLHRPPLCLFGPESKI